MFYLMFYCKHTFGGGVTLGLNGEILFVSYLIKQGY